MIVSWNWLRQYVELSITPEEFARRLMSVEAQAIFQAFLARRPPGR